MEVVTPAGATRHRTAYDPVFCAKLSEEPHRTLLNADSYAWFATASYLPPKIWHPGEELEILKSRPMGNGILAEWNETEEATARKLGGLRY